jgi:hypothetical protein
VIEVVLLIVKLVAVVVPNFTALALVNAVPVIVTLVPAASGPAFGAMLATVGGAA